MSLVARPSLQAASLLALAGCTGVLSGGADRVPADADTGPHVDVGPRDALDSAASADAPGPGTEPDADVSLDAHVAAPCTDVAHIGDSLTYYPRDAIPPLYEAAGMTVQVNAHGGRAVLRRRSDDTITGKEAAMQVREAGFDGCWVVALGTNDTVYVANGAAFTRAQSIDEMMLTIDASAEARVMWVNTFTSPAASGSYTNDNMIRWNDELLAAQARWPNLRIFDWASIAAKGVAPFTDGVHHTTEGYAVRDQAIVSALQSFYPP